MKSRKIPMEWMGPVSWRLPSGKALAEFALQAGFLAPLLLGNNPTTRVSKPASPHGPVPGAAGKLTKVHE